MHLGSRPDLALSFLFISCEVGFKILMQGKETFCDVSSL